MLTVALIKRRSEHHNGELKDMEEITLHQFDLENINILAKKCPRLKIVYLQGNQLTRLPLLRLHYLDTLMLQMNNLQDVDGLQECLNLRVLDLTLNFISDLQCLIILVRNKKLKELTLQGNPIANMNKYLSFMLVTFDLTMLDHEEINKTQQLTVRNDHPNRMADIEFLLKSYKPMDIVIDHLACLPNEYVTAELYATQKCGHTIEERIKAARELKILRSKENDEKTVPILHRRVYENNGNVLQCNEHDWKFNYSTTTSTIQFKVFIPKIIDTSALECSIEACYIKIIYNNKRLQVKSMETMQIKHSVISRSKASGTLLFSAYKQGQSGIMDASQMYLQEKLTASQRVNVIQDHEQEDEQRELPTDLPDLI